MPKHHHPGPHGHGPHHKGHHHPRHHHRERFLDALELLVETGHVSSVAELVRFAERSEEADAADFLRKQAEESIPVDLALYALRAEVELGAYRRNTKLLSECSGLAVGLILPLPHHVTDGFVQLEKTKLLVPNGHDVPPHLEDEDLEVHEGTRACRDVVAELGVIVFEAFRNNGCFRIDPEVADVLDLRIIPTTTLLIVHLKPHDHAHDVALSPTKDRIRIL